MVITPRDDPNLVAGGSNTTDSANNQTEQQQVVAPQQHNLNVNAHVAGQEGNQQQAARNEVFNNKISFMRPPKPLVSSGENIAHNWNVWIQQYSWFEVAMKMQMEPQDVQVATFMTAIGTEAVHIFNTFGCTPAELVNIDAIKLKFSQYFTPKVNKTYERYIFNRMKQEDNEPFDEFLTRVKSQGTKCGFRDLYESLLCDKITVGINSETLREQLLADDEPSLDRVTQRCRAAEQALKQLRGFKDDSKIQAIKTSGRHQAQSSSTVEVFNCNRCGRQHGPRSCPAYKKKCNKCHKIGHFSEMCQNSSGSRQRQKPQHSRKLNSIEESTLTDDEDLFINSIQNGKRSPSNLDDTKHWLEEVEILNLKVKIKLDSGAERNVIPKSIADQINAIKTPCNKRLVSYSGHKMQAVNQITAKTKIREKFY